MTTGRLITPPHSRKIKALSLFAIILVVYLHAYNVNPPFLTPESKIAERADFNNCTQFFLSNGLARIAVPLFFMLSGFLFFLRRGGGTKEFVRGMVKRVRTLLIPYLLWNALGIALVVFLLQINPIGRFIPGYLQQRTALDYLRSVYTIPVAFQLWFLRDLMALVALSPLLYVILKRKIGVLFLVLAVFCWLRPMWRYEAACEALLFFGLGSFIAIHDCCLPVFRLKWMAVGFAITWIILLVVKTALAFGAADSRVLFLLHKLGIVAGLFSVWYGYDHLVVDIRPEGRTARVAAFTFFIYAFHEPLLNIAMPNTLMRVGSAPMHCLLAYLILPALTITLAVGMAFLLRQHLPRLYSWLTGGRGVN